MILRKPLRSELGIYKKLEIEFYLHHKPYKTLVQDVDPRKRNLRKEFVELLEGRNNFFRFLEAKGVVVGYIYGLIKKIGENEKGWKRIGVLNSIVISKAFRKKGLSGILTNGFFKWLKKRKIAYVESSSNVKNKQSMDFHKRLKFKQQHIEFGRLV